MLTIGLDIGSTTLKCVVTDENKDILYKNYLRHYSRITEKVAEMLDFVRSAFPGEKNFVFGVSGSAGMGFSEKMNVQFVQEVYATRLAVKALKPETDVVIELGGEDAKILFLTGTMEVRMNGTCAGGTGAFIDQMSTLLGMTPSEMDEAAKSASKIYAIASRCGVFAKSDIQPLLNQGAQKNDLSKSIFAAVANQTIAGLAQGREICGNILYLGGPLTYLSQLRETFDTAINQSGILPDNSLYYVAFGTSLASSEIWNLDELTTKVKNMTETAEYNSCEPLFKDETEYAEFSERHDKDDVLSPHELTESRVSYIGIDAGSTTVKCVLINENEEMVYQDYRTNSGNPVPIVKSFLEDIYRKYPDIRILGSASTGYGEDLVHQAFRLDHGIVETMAHFLAAEKFNPNVDFIVDIGGQDIKCFKIVNGSIDNIFLNEACSSGCGSFLQTFAKVLGYSTEQFAKIGLFAKNPVDLGSRCTVFMNSSVKQAQKDGATIDNISAGLCISVVKNAIYKVIRAQSASLLGENIVVQGGTFYNDAVLRAFEKEIGHNVIRPKAAGLMGAYGAALFAKRNSAGSSSIISSDELASFTHNVAAVTCQGCTNRCRLTVNTFNGGRRYLGGNRCEKPLKLQKAKEKFNLYAFKRELLDSYADCSGNRETVGIPMGLNMYELYPFWHTLFASLGFGVVKSPVSTRKLYLKGQHTIPSDTVCYPAKIVHGHIEALLCDERVDAVFYPCMSYNIDENIAENHYNCPVVAYYPEVIKANTPQLKNKKFIYDYVGIHERRDFPRKLASILRREFGGIKESEVKKACDKAYAEYYSFMSKIREKGREYINAARERHLPVIVLAGRPYHIDPEINHGIDDLICDSGAVVVTEDSLSRNVDELNLDVLNQWTYHSRLYAAAKYISESGENKDMNIIQLVSFGCGVDAVTGDEVRRILRKNDRIYTQIKIDEVTNLGAVKIRLRSLFAAVGQKR